MAWSEETKRALKTYGKGRTGRLLKQEDLAEKRREDDEKWGWARGALQGAGSGGALGGAIGGPGGAAIGAVGGGIAGGLLGSQGPGGESVVNAASPALAPLARAVSPDDRLLDQYDKRNEIDWGGDSGEGGEGGNFAFSAPPPPPPPPQGYPPLGDGIDPKTGKPYSWS